MKLNKNVFLSIVFLSLLFCLSGASATPKKAFNKSDIKDIEKIRTQILYKLPGLKEKIKQDKVRQQSESTIYENKKKLRLDAASLKKQFKRDTKNIKLIINTSKDINGLSDKLKTFGVRTIKSWDNMAAVEVPAENLEKMFNEIESIKTARLPRRVFPQDVQSEGVAVTDSNDFHNIDYFGEGVKVAVIDVGFKGLTEAQLNGDLPGSVETWDFTGNGLETEYYHGTACAEIIYDMAPQAEFHLLKVLYSTDILQALEYCIDNSIDIISFSIGTSGTGPGDGTGPFDEAFDEVREHGILTVASAGNGGNFTSLDGVTIGAHWKGVFRDSNNDNCHEFLDGNTEVDINIFGAYATTNDDGDPEDGEVSVLLRWNDWIKADIDYDMILFEYDPETGDVEEIASSTYVQDGSPYEPVEYISLDISDNEPDPPWHYYAVAIVKEAGSDNVEMELSLGMTSVFLPFDANSDPIATSSSSLNEPADAESVLAVGAIDYERWTTGPQEGFSSQGPTNAWAGSIARRKPDVMGPDGISTYTYGSSSSGDGFYGTSAATPHVAGLAALILSKYPGMTPDELQDAIESNAIDMGTYGKDNIYGWGRIQAITDLSDDTDDDDDDGSSGGGGGGGCFVNTAGLDSFAGSYIVLFLVAVMSVFIVIKAYARLKKSEFYARNRE